MTGALIPLLLVLAADDGREASYRRLVAQGVEEGRQGHLAEARQALDQAVALDPQAPAAWRERGGLQFLRRDYLAAAADFERAWRLGEDEYSGRMLGTSLHLAGRHLEALDAWNRVRMPRVRTIRVEGEDGLPEAMVRREIAATEGEILTAGQVRASLLRLEETDAFGRVSLRPVPLPGGEADLDVYAAGERGFGSKVEFVGRLAANAIGEKVRLRYKNLLPGVTPGIDYKWEDTQPRLRGTLFWVRPLGIDVNLDLTAVAFHRPQYDLDAAGPFRMRSSGFDLALRRVVGPDTVGELGFRTRTRSFSRVRPDTPEGRWSGLEAAVEHRFLTDGRHRADGALRLFQTAGSDVTFGQALASVRYRVAVAGDDGSVMPESEAAARLLGGWTSGDTPLDAMFAPGAASEMDFPVRGHRQKRGGILGRAPIGRRLGLLNVEWRQRLLQFTSTIALGGVVFYDAAHVAATAQGSDRRTLHDVGAGLRLRVGGLILRADYGTSLTGEGNNALTVGFGQVF